MTKSMYWVYVILYGLLLLSFPISITGVQVAIGLALVFCPLAAQTKVVRMEQPEGFPRWLFLLFAVVPLIAVWTAPDLLEAAKWYRRYMYIVTVPVIALTVPLVKEHWRSGLALFLFSFGTASLYAVLQVFLGPELDRPFKLVGYYVHASGFLSKSNTFAEVMLFGFLATLFAAHHCRTRLRRWMAGALAVVILLAIVFSRSRTPIAVSVIVGAIYVWHVMSRRVWVILLVTLAVLATAHVANNRVFWRFSQIEKDVGTRTRIWGYAWDAFRDHPVAGHGLGCFQTYLTSHAGDSDQDLLAYDHAHNNLLESAAGSGLIGLTMFLLFWGTVFMQSLTAFLREKEPIWKSGFLIMLLGIASVHLTGLTECTLMDTEVVLLLYFWLGVFYFMRGQRVRQGKL